MADEKSQLEEISAEEFESVLEAQLEQTQLQYETILRTYQKYLKDKYNPKYRLRYFSDGMKVFYRKEKKEWGFIKDGNR